MKYRISDIAGIVQGDLFPAFPDAEIGSLLIDSRKITFPAASLFFALPGPRRDGHLFIAELYKQGVFNFVVKEDFAGDEFPAANFIYVPDVLQALQRLAAWHRQRFTIPVIGITGSNGKTIVKEWLNQLLEPRMHIVRSPASYNSQIGVPLSVWQMNQRDQLAIFEAGISEAGEMDHLEPIIRPTIGIFTTIGEAHSAGFSGLQQKVREKLRLFRRAGTIIYCKDYGPIEEEIHALNREEEVREINLFSWSLHTEATLRIVAVNRHSHTTFLSGWFEERSVSVVVPFTDDASIENAITCWCTLLYLELDPEFIREHLLTLSHIAMRLELKQGISNCSVINDSYSADLSSLQIALDFLSQQQQHARKTVILSDILQSDRSDTDLYREVAGYLAQRHVNRLIGIGEVISKQGALFEEAAGMQAVLYEDVPAFLKDFYKIGFANETILLKGARVFRFEQISRLLEEKIHQTVLEINQSALVYNLKQYQKLLKPQTRLMAMVKAFSYGSGSFEIANLLQFHKVDYLAVAYADEGIELRESGITLPIMVMNPEEDSFEAIVHYKLEPDIYSLTLFSEFDIFLKQKRLIDFPVHLEIETGMNRLGFPMQEISALTEQLAGSSFQVKSVFSHLASSEDPEQDDFTRQQHALFLEACAQLQEALAYPFIRHIANSAAIARHPELQMDMVRLGIGLYGIDSTEGNRLELKEVSSLITTIAQVKYIAAGESVGYGRRWKAEKDSVIATVRLGYADGYTRRLGHGAGRMLVKGQLAPVVGSVCMDMTMIDITGINGVEPEDEVVVFGKGLPVTQVAHWAGTIPYEIMTGVSQRVKRIYFEES